MILITGGFGLLGSRITESLLNAGHKVRITSREAETAELPKELKGSKLLSIDLSDQQQLDKLCDDVSVIVHLAATNAQVSHKNPEQALKVNGLGTYNLLESAKRKKINHFIYFSTAHVYNTPLAGFLDEDSPTFPKHHYSITHRLAEDYVSLASKDTKMNATVFRLSNAIGAPVLKSSDCWMLAVNDLAKQCVINNKMVFRSNINERRDFITIDDVCRAVKFELTRTRSEPYELFNLGSNKTITLGDLSQLISHCSKKIFNIEPEIIFPDSENTDAINLEKLEYSNKKLLNNGFELKGNIEDEITNLLIKTKEWFVDGKD